ncbi:MAG: PilZ domain-containing protein [Proteobacteria bacterium]|nr:PilZ domain-containing protein [Pseudomonadota bacterium]
MTDRIRPRMSGRIPVQIPIEYQIDGEWLKGVVIDLSVGGIRILTSQVVEKGIKLRINFSLGGEEELLITGDVSNINAREIPDFGVRNLVGVNFPGLTEAEKKKLQDFILNQRYYTRLYRPTKGTDYLEEQNLKKAAALLKELE